jgi:hypothetical protein
MAELSKAKAQIYVALLMFALWVVGILVAAWDGDAMVRAMTPLMTMSMGWLFTGKATE